jgi:hypothetical protein
MSYVCLRSKPFSTMMTMYVESGLLAEVSTQRDDCLMPVSDCQ